MAVPDIACATAINNPKLIAVKDTDIDDSGTFKYILMKVHDDNEDFKYIVRGTARAEYHADIYDIEVAKIEKDGLECEVMGGGRIQLDPSQKTIKIYGYSVAFGPANHAITKVILKHAYPDYIITWTKDGY